MKRFLAGYVIPFNAFAFLMFLVIGGFNLIIPEESQIGFWIIVGASYGLVSFAVILALLIFAMFHLMEWLDDWSRN